MDITGWERRYRADDPNIGYVPPEPTPLVRRFAEHLPSGTALDLAAGTGRNALWLAGRGWRVTAVDGAVSALETIDKRSQDLGVPLETVLADLKRGEYQIATESWDLITICHYLQRDLLESAKAGVRPGGVAVVIVHITEGYEKPTDSRLSPSELLSYFVDWTVLHHYEGKPNDPEHRRAVAEVVARKP